MDHSTLIAAMGIIVNVAAMIVGGVWAVSKIGRQTAVLDANLLHLSASIDRLAHTIGKLDGRVDDHDRRITVIETRLQHGGGGGGTPV